MIWIGTDRAFPVRIQGRSHNAKKFVEGDGPKCKDWLGSIEVEGKKKKEEVGLAELLEMLLEELRAPEARCAKEKEEGEEK